MNVDSASPVLTPITPPLEEEAPLAKVPPVGDAASTTAGGQLGYTIILPTPEQLKLLEEMGLPISQEELDTLKQQKAEQDRAERGPLLQAGALPPPQLPPNPY